MWKKPLIHKRSHLEITEEASDSEYAASEGSNTESEYWSNLEPSSPPQQVLPKEKKRNQRVWLQYILAKRRQELRFKNGLHDLSINVVQGMPLRVHNPIHDASAFCFYNKQRYCLELIRSFYMNAMYVEDQDGRSYSFKTSVCGVAFVITPETINATLHIQADTTES